MLPACSGRSPSILALSREQTLIQQRLVDEMQNIAASAQKAYDANDALVTSLKKQMDVVKAEAGSATLDEASIESMVRDTEIKRQQYAELYKKASDLETERRVLRGSTRLVSLAELPNKPFFPKKIPFLAAGATLALIFGIGAALLADRIDPVENQDEVPAPPQAAAHQVASEAAEAPAAPSDEPPSDQPDPPLPPDRKSHLPEVADVPILACLPRLKTLRQLSAVGAILQDYRHLTIPQVLRLASEDGEFQRTVHALVQELGIGASGPAQRIVVTSPGEGDGKTTTVFALAEHLAAAGRRVLVVGCDPHDPAFAQVLPLPAGPGLLGVLSGVVSLSNAVVRTDHPDLDVLPLGAGAADTLDQLFSANLVQRLSGLDGYDAILIDSPLPAQASDFLAGVDQVILCVRSDRSLIEPAISAVNRAKALGADSLAIVVTMTETAQAAAQQPSFTAAAYARAG